MLQGAAFGSLPQRRGSGRNCRLHLRSLQGYEDNRELEYCLTYLRMAGVQALSWFIFSAQLRSDRSHCGMIPRQLAAQAINGLIQRLTTLEEIAPKIALFFQPLGQGLNV
jgi:hypothetical protein